MERFIDHFRIRPSVRINLSRTFLKNVFTIIAFSGGSMVIIGTKHYEQAVDFFPTVESTHSSADSAYYDLRTTTEKAQAIEEKSFDDSLEAAADIINLGYRYVDRLKEYYDAVDKYHSIYNRAELEVRARVDPS